MKYINSIVLAFLMLGSSYVLAAAVTEQFVLRQQITVTATTTSTQVLPANINRNYLLIQNNGSSVVNVKIGSIQSSTEAIQLASSGGSVEFKVCPTDSIWVKSASGTDQVSIIEGNAQ